MSGAQDSQNPRWMSGTETREPVEKGSAPRIRSAATNPREINGQNNHDCDPDPGGVTGDDSQLYRAPMFDSGPWENQVGIAFATG